MSREYKIVDQDAALQVCIQLIESYVHDPEDVDWSDIQNALSLALKAVGLPDEYIEEEHERREELVEVADILRVFKGKKPSDKMQSKVMALLNDHNKQVLSARVSLMPFEDFEAWMKNEVFV